METVLITGGTGMIGKALTAALLRRNYHVIIVTRKMPGSKPTVNNISYALWDVEAQTIDKEAIAEADHIIHLAGANVGEKRWTKKRKKEIVDSRVKSGELLVKALRDIPNKVQTVLSASAIGWYGPDTAQSMTSGFDEDDKAANDFLGKTCLQWENSIRPVEEIGKRLVIFRTGIVFAKGQGALKEFEKPLQFRVATILGNGKQVISWIHLDDIVNVYILALENKNYHGIYNAVAPHPVTNKDLVLQLAKARDKFYISVKVPSFILRTVLGEMSIEVLKSATVSADKLIQAGFTFQYPTVQSFL